MGHMLKVQGSVRQQYRTDTGDRDDGQSGKETFATWNEKPVPLRAVPSIH